MRVTTDFWVSALVRRVFADGGFAAVISRGAAEAGVVHILTRDRLGDVTLYSPAPQTSYDDARPEDRRFSCVAGLSPEQLEQRLDKERRFDPDFWIVEIEPGRAGIAELISIAT